MNRIEFEILYRQKLSQRNMARKLNVSVRTVKREIQKIYNKDERNLTFAKNLEQIAKTAPTDFARHELNRTVLRLRKGVKFESLYPLILRCMENGAICLSDFVEDTNLSPKFLRAILTEMVAREILTAGRSACNEATIYKLK